MGFIQGTRTRGFHHRRGLSFVEFMGCLLALGGGVALGSVYLGVDMKTMFFGVLERAELVDPGFFSSQAAAEEEIAAEGENSVAAESSPESPPLDANSETATTKTSETASSQADDGTSAQRAQGESGTVDTELSEPELTEEEKQAATKRYWLGLTASMREEASQRSAVSVDPENWLLFDYLTHRLNGHEKAVEAIEKLEERGVDQRLIWHSKQVLSWNQAGVNLYRRSVGLLTDSPSDQLTGPFAQSWQSAATQHRMEEKLVRDKHFSLAGYLDHTFKDQAPFKPAF